MQTKENKSLLPLWKSAKTMLASTALNMKHVQYLFVAFYQSRRYDFRIIAWKKLLTPECTVFVSDYAKTVKGTLQCLQYKMYSLQYKVPSVLSSVQSIKCSSSKMKTLWSRDTCISTFLNRAHAAVLTSTAPLPNFPHTDEMSAMSYEVYPGLLHYVGVWTHIGEIESCKTSSLQDIAMLGPTKLKASSQKWKQASMLLEAEPISKAAKEHCAQRH